MPEMTFLANYTGGPVVHGLPQWGATETPCCGLKPDELPEGDRMTSLHYKETCRIASLTYHMGPTPQADRDDRKEP